MQAVRAGPEEQEAVPARVVRHVPQQPLLRLADARVVARVRHHPRRRALEDEQPARHAWRPPARAGTRSRRCRSRRRACRRGRAGAATRAEWKAGPANESRPGMSGSLGRLSWPTALITALASSVSSPPSRARTRTSQRAGAVVPARRDDLGAEADALRARRSGRRSARSTRAARRAARRTPASRGSARTSSSRSGWRRRPGSPGSCSRARCRRRRRSSRCTT